ncbi:MAG TPA: hypothetical protein VGK61_05955 [Planctomycetota bacterium]|jgi:hypothetical protein
MDLFTIVLKEDLAADPRKYGALLAPALGVTVLEAKIAVRRGRGIFLADAPGEDARRIAEALKADGIDSWCIPNDEVPSTAAPRRITDLERAEAALQYRPPGAAKLQALPWESIGTISLGAVALPSYRDRYPGLHFDHFPALHRVEDPATRELLREKVMLRMGESELRRRAAVPVKVRADDRSLFEDLQRKHARELKVYADLVTGEGATWLRVPMDEIAYLPGAGVRFGEAWGFHQLVMELVRRRPGARTEVSRRFEPGTDVNELVFQTTEDFNRYTSWNVIRKILWERDASSSPSPAPRDPRTAGGSSSASPEPEPRST